MDITNFITWFINQTISIISSFFTIMANIEFAGTNLLKFSINVFLIGLLLPVILSLGKAHILGNQGRGRD